jgi:hypothetical protein
MGIVLMMAQEADLYPIIGKFISAVKLGGAAENVNFM